MIPLIKIRATYLKRKKGTLIFSYLLMPLIIIISIIIYMIKKDKSDPITMIEKQEFNYDSDFYLFGSSEQSNYSQISVYLRNTSLVVEDEKIGKALVKFINDKTKVSLKLYSNEDQLNNHSQSVIVLDYNEKKKKYKFTYKEKQIINQTIGFPFVPSLLSTEGTSNVFKYEFDKYQMTEIQNKNFFIYQSLLSSFLIEYENKSRSKDLHFNLGLNSYPPTVKTSLNYDILEQVLGYLITLQFSFIFLSFSIQMLEEKEQKLEKLLERQGISTKKYILSWLLNFLIVSLMANISCVLGATQILTSFMGIFFIDMILFNFAQFSLLFFIVSVSSNKKTGIILVNLLNFGSLIIGLVLVQGNTNKIIQSLFNIFPNANLLCSVKLIIKLQNLGKFSWDNIRLSYNGISCLDTFIMFIVEIIFYVFLSFFIKAYKDSGLSFFSFIKSIFTKVHREINIQSIDNEINELERNHEELNEINSSLKSQNHYLNIKNVTRKYDELIAVNNFSGEIFENEIFCLLGHNGAGKTTLIKMISGTEDPDNGDILLNGTSVITNKQYLYRNIGLCQQEDIFFDYLTVSEHLKFMVEIKGIKKDYEHINNLINKIGLKEKKDSFCKILSGGEKRKLCIALALIGDSQLVLLDEPTSGMDVMAKRALWDFLKEFKENKIIILTTHSLDEAEYLGDRIGIMSNGHFICSGTSSYLKTKYPCGFNLNLIVNPSVFNANHKQQLYNQLIKYEPNLAIKISSKGLFSINIQSNNKSIKEIFNIIENNKAEYGIEDYTVSSTSLEDVFLKLNHKITINDENDEKKEENNEIIEIEQRYSINKSSASFFSQLKAHTKRGFFSLWRNKGFSFLELLMGLFILYIYVIIYYSALGKQSQNILNLTQILENNDIFICEDNKDFFKSSYVYQDLSSINLKTIKNKNQNEKKEFIEEIYQNALGNIGKAGICITNINENKNNYEIINTEIPMQNPGYIMANSMLTVSAFLKKEYNIDAVIFDKIINLISTEKGMSQNEISVMISLCFGTTISLCIYLGTIIAEKIKERAKNIKHILYLSGSNMWSYWCGFYFVDIIKMLIFSSLAAPSIYFINNYATYIWINLIFLSFSSLFFTYCLSFLFEKEESGQKAMNFLLFFIIILVVIFVIIILALDLNIDYSFLLNSYNYTIIDFTPISSFVLSSIRLTFGYIVFKAMGNAAITDLDKINFPPLGTVYHPDHYIKTSLIVNSINCGIYFFLLILFESGIMGKSFNNLKVKFLIRESNITFSNEMMSEEFQINNTLEESPPLLENNERNYDSINEVNADNNNIINNNIINNNNMNNNNNNINPYVQNEINKINNDFDNRLTTKIIGLKKTYWQCCKKNVRAINNLYLGLEINEKFGLLGFNGSGKTTTFKSITKEILFDSGDIILFGYNNKTQFTKIRQAIGYCPQENPLFDYMKVKEILKFYLELKGVNESVQNICDNFGLGQYLETYCVNLSGGNKRKLSFAIALMCRPKILLLDEPSTGVDPESRRIMWKNIMELTKKTNLNMILSTHSMEEAEVLCDTVSWLKSGNFLSIGNPEQLKIKLSAGYKLHIKFIQLSQDQNIINEEIDDQFIQQISSNIKGLNNHYEFIKQKASIKPYLNELVNVIESIKDKCSEITLQKINKDLSFDFNIHVLKERQSLLFAQVLDMKNVNNLLSEISISMESLENILTKL